MRRVLRTQRLSISDDHIAQLMHGRDFLGTGYGDECHLTAGEWATAVERMRRDWQDPAVRTRVWEKHYKSGRQGKPWAASMFDEVLSTNGVSQK